jgi:hypothetical protein
MPWSLMKWYLTQNRSPAALTHMYVCELYPFMCRQVRDASVTHQPGHLVRRLRRQRREVPLHVVVAR